MEKIDEEMEERLERIRRRKLEWKARRAQKAGIMIKKDMDNGVEVEKDAKLMGAHKHNEIDEMEGQEAHTPGP